MILLVGKYVIVPWLAFFTRLALKDNHYIFTQLQNFKSYLTCQIDPLSGCRRSSVDSSVHSNLPPGFESQAHPQRFYQFIVENKQKKRPGLAHFFKKVDASRSVERRCSFYFLPLVRPSIEIFFFQLPSHKKRSNVLS